MTCSNPTRSPPALEGCDAAYYLVHSIGTGGDFAATEATAARNVRDAADVAGLRRIVYLGGMGSGDDLSKHLASRHHVGEILASGRTATTELRAAVIIGSGSISFEMLRYLTEVLPAMVTPRWVRTKCQPIAISDVLHYLTAVLDDPETVDRVLEIGGPDVVTYAEMMQTYAEVAGLPRRIIVPVPLLSPRLSSRWVGLVTPLPARIAVPLIDSLRHEVVMTNHDIDTLVPHQPLTFRASLELALRHTRAEAIDTRWTDAGFASADAIPGDPDWAGGSIFEDHQTVESDATPEALYRAFARIGGEHGYYVVNWAWSLRGLADKLIGGPGLRRGRRHPVDLRPGESLDFWRVVEVEPGHQLVLEAEMKVPGKAWLTWRIEPGRPESGHAAAAPGGVLRSQGSVRPPLLVHDAAVPLAHLPAHGTRHRRPRGARVGRSRSPFRGDSARVARRRPRRTARRGSTTTSPRRARTSG